MRRSRHGISPFVLAVCGATVFASTVPAKADPTVIDPSRYRIELFSDFAPLGGNLKVFDLLLTEGRNGVAPGLYAMSGPAGDARSDRLVRISQDGTPTPFASGFRSNEAFVLAEPGYGDGLLVSIPLQQQIVRLLGDGSVQPFARGFSTPFGPSGMAFTDGRLFASDNGSNSIIEVDAVGNLTLFADVTEDDPPWYCAIPNLFCAIKGLVMSASDDSSSPFGDWLVAATFSAPLNDGTVRPGVDSVFTVSRTGEVALLFTGLDGIELIEFGPGGPFGTDLFVPAIGGAQNGDGGLYSLSPDGQLTQIVSGIDAVSVAFDTMGSFGGGMFIADINDQNGAGRIWRLVPVAEPAMFAMSLVAVIGLVATRRGPGLRRDRARLKTHVRGWFQSAP